MPLIENMSENHDKTVNYSVTGVKEHCDLAVSAGLFASNLDSPKADFAPKHMRPNAPSTSVAGVNIGVEHADGHGASLTAQHSQSFGNSMTAATKVNVLNTDNHRVDVNAFTTRTMPIGPMPSFQTHGGGVDYQFKETFSASASMSHTPMFKQRDYSVSTRVNLLKSPTSSLGVNVGAHRTDTMFGRGQWQPGTSFVFKKSF